MILAILVLLCGISGAKAVLPEKEKLVFEVRFLGINVGQAIMEITGNTNFAGKQVKKFNLVTRSAKWYSKHFNVHDVIRSYWDPVKRVSHRFVKRLSEGKYKNNLRIDFDYEKRLAFFEGEEFKGNFRKGQKKKKVKWKKRKGKKKIPEGVCDALSCLYYARDRELKVGQSFTIDVFDDGRNSKVKVNVLRKEKIRVKAGRFNAIAVEPLMSTTGVFEHRGKITVWLDDRPGHMPLKVESKIYVGYITAELIEVK